MVSGSSIYGTIGSKIDSAEEEVNKVNREIRSYDTQVQRLNNEREETFELLAGLFLPEMTKKAVTTTLHEMKGNVQDIFQEKQRRIKDLEETIRNSKITIADLNEEIDTTTKQIDLVEDRRTTVSLTIKEELEGNDRYLTLKKSVDHTKENLDDDLRRAEELEKEAAEKLPLFEAGKLFMYLVNKSFGTSRYNPSSNWVKKKDKWVSRVANFEKNNKSYDYLTQMPQVLRSEVETRRSEFMVSYKELEELQTSIEENHGLEAIIGEEQELVSKRNGEVSLLDQEERRHHSALSERRELDNTQGRYHQRAIGEMGRYLKNSSIAELWRKAEETETQEDDRLVERIKAINSHLNTIDIEQEELIIKRDELETKVEGLQDLKSDFRRKGYESDRSVFGSGFNIDDVLTGYMLGNMGRDDVWSDIDSSQDFKAPPVTYGTNNYNSPVDNDSSSSFGGGSVFDSFGGGGDSFSGGDMFDDF